VYGSHYNGIIFRSELPQADDLIERAKDIYEGVATFNQQQTAFRFHNGARLRFRPLRTVSDAQKYQGQNLSDACIEEAGTYPDPAPILRLFAALRSSHGIPTSLFMTGNPGGPGQQWIKARYVDPNPSGMVPIIQRFGDHQHTAIFIPSKVAYNKILLANDPNYIANLHLVGNAELVRAWLEGDWNAIEGAFFDNWSNFRHTCPPFEVPDHWLRFRSVDWGSARPFSVGWWAVASDDTMIREGQWLPRGGLLRINEWYGASAPNVGLKMTAEEVARGIVDRTTHKQSYTVVDPAMFAEDGGPSLAERFARAGVVCVPADNKRVGTLGNMGGWDMLRQRLNGEAEDRPMMIVFDTCADTIRTLPALQHDLAKPEDLDSDMEDHAADEIRYAAMSRPWVKEAKKDYDPIKVAIQPATFDDAMKQLDFEQSARKRL
jgi:hypothetical protein